MKRFCLFLFIALVILQITTAQESGQGAKKLLYTNTSGEKGVSFFEYDGTSKLIKGRWQLKDTSRWSANFYHYNEKNQLIEKYREFSDSMTSSLKYEYDTEGKKIAEIFSRSDGRAGKSVFKYSGSGRLEKIICNKYNGWFDGIIIIKTWQGKNPLTADIFRDDEKVGYINYGYNELGNLKKEYWDFNGSWSQTFIWVYEPVKRTYTSSNVFISENSRFRLTKENYSFNGETGGPSFFTYSENGTLEEKIFIRSDSLKTRTTFEYDEEGILIQSFRHYSNGKTGVFTYEFNADRKLVSRLFKRSDGVDGNEKYTYNSEGQLIKAEWENFDNWLSGTITFEHNRAGLISKGYFKGEDGFDAELIFSYDNYGNLSKIHWDFSFGKTQTYWFEYSQLD